MDNQTAPEVAKIAGKTAPPTRKLPLIIAFTALLGSIGSLIIGYEIARDVRQEHTTTNQEIKMLTNSHSENQTKFEKAEQVANENAENIKKLQAQLVTLGTSVQEVTEANQTVERRLRYSEVEYVLRLAQLNLHFQKNQTTALALLHHADDQLKNLNDPGSTAFREALSKTISQLEALPAVDTTGILSQLTAINSEITTLPILSITLPKADQSSVTENTDGNKRALWQAVWESMLDQIKHFVTIRRLDQPIKPLLAEADQTLLTRTIQYLLQQAEWAVTQKDAAVYQQSLLEAQGMIKAHYNLTASSTDSVLMQLKKLQEQTISTELPDISELVRQASLLRPRSATTGARAS